jgi:hypothetical protein
MISHLIWLIASNNLDVNKFHTFYIAYDACNWILQSIDLFQSVYLKLHYDLKWDLLPCYLSKWNIIKKTTKFFPKTKLLVDELINDWVNDEIEWAFHGFDLRSWHGLFKSKQELVPLFGFITLKSWLLLEKFFKKVFFLSLKTFSWTRKNYNLTLTSL